MSRLWRLDKQLQGAFPFIQTELSDYRLRVTGLLEEHTLLLDFSNTDLLYVNHIKPGGKFARSGLPQQLKLSSDARKYQLHIYIVHGDEPFSRELHIVDGRGSLLVVKVVGGFPQCLQYDITQRWNQPPDIERLLFVPSDCDMNLSLSERAALINTQLALTSFSVDMRREPFSNREAVEIRHRGSISLRLVANGPNFRIGRWDLDQAQTLLSRGGYRIRNEEGVFSIAKVGLFRSETVLQLRAFRSSVYVVEPVRR